jgi:hypothetical protein
MEENTEYTRETEKEERKRKREIKILCACCGRTMTRANDVYEVPGAYINSTRHKANICYWCAVGQKKILAGAVI